MTKKSVIYDKNLELDIYIPDQPSFDTIIYFHGGGVETGDKCDPINIDISERFAREGICYVSVNYSLYPNTKFPDFLYECAKSIRYVKDNICSLGGNGTIYVSGQSAGAYITLMLCFNHEYLDSVGVKNDDIAGWISDSAQTTSHFNVQHFETGRDPWLQRIDEYAPLYYVNKETTFKRLYLDFYENDMPCRVEQNNLLISILKFYHPEADIYSVLLPGGHCQGSSQKDDDGEYPYVKQVLAWLNK